MNNRYGWTALIVTCVLASGLMLYADEFSAISVGARRHMDHSVFLDLPFGDEDFSYALAYEYHEDIGYWQIAVNYMPDPSGTAGTNSADSIDYVITPQINLIIKDGPWRGGLGALRSYIHDKEKGGDWPDLYWQFILGVHLPVMAVQIDVHAFYVFEDWDMLDEFEFKDVEFGIWLNYTF